MSLSKSPLLIQCVSRPRPSEYCPPGKLRRNVMGLYTESWHTEYLYTVKKIPGIRIPQYSEEGYARSETEFEW